MSKINIEDQFQSHTKREGIERKAEQSTCLILHTFALPDRSCQIQIQIQRKEPQLQLQLQLQLHPQSLPLPVQLKLTVSSKLIYHFASILDTHHTATQCHPNPELDAEVAAVGQPQSQPKPPVIQPSFPHHTPHLRPQSVGRRPCLQSLQSQSRQPVAPLPTPEVEVAAVAVANPGQWPEPIMTLNQVPQALGPGALLLGLSPNHKLRTIVLPLILPLSRFVRQICALFPASPL